MYIENALQNVKFSLNESGGSLISEAGIKDEYKLEVIGTRYFYFNNDFIVFMKEENADMPYFSLNINDTSILIKE